MGDMILESGTHGIVSEWTDNAKKWDGRKSPKVGTRCRMGSEWAVHVAAGREMREQKLATERSGNPGRKNEISHGIHTGNFVPYHFLPSRPFPRGPLKYMWGFAFYNGAIPRFQKNRIEKSTTILSRIGAPIS